LRYVIVGNGIAGTEAALLLRRRDARAEITIVSSEHDHLFSRPALMYVLCGQLRLQDTEPFDRKLYQRLRIRLVRGRVAKLTAAERQIELEGGLRLPYDKLLLATGSLARVPEWTGLAGPQVHSFVTLDDCQALAREAQPGQRAVVVGGGLIGVEVAEVLRMLGLAVTFLVRESWYFPVALSVQEGALVAERIQAHGCDLRLGVTVTELVRTAEGRLTTVSTNQGAFPCDLVVCAIGVTPNTSFLRNSGLTLAPGGGIEVDSALRTNLADVWAAGDCANVTWADGSRRPEQLWYTARDQGRVAARSMLGDAACYSRTEIYNSAKFFDLEYTMAGFVPALRDAAGGSAVEPPGVTTWFRRQRDRPAAQRILVRDGRVIGFSMLGSRFDHALLLRWIAEQRELSWVLAHLRAAQFDEELEPAVLRLPLA